MDGFFCYDGTNLIPADDRTKEYCKRRQGEVLTVTIHGEKYSRDLVKHNQFFAVLSRAVDNMDYVIISNATHEAAIEDLLLKLKYATGFIQDFTGIDGSVRMVPRSLDFDRSTEQDAETFRVLAYNVLCQLLGVTRQELFTG